MAAFLDSVVQRELRGALTKGRGGLENAELVLASVICFGVLSACVFLWANGICRMLCRFFVKVVTAMKYMLIIFCRPRVQAAEPPAKSQASAPVLRPEMQQPPTPRFSFRNPSMLNQNHPFANRNARSVKASNPGQPEFAFKCLAQRQHGRFSLRHASVGKAFESGEKPKLVATDDVPRLLGRERSLAIPWHLLEADKKCKRYKREFSGTESRSDRVISASQVEMCSTVPTKNVPVLDSENLPRLLGRTWHTEEVVEHSWKGPGACILGSECEKNNQRSRKKPCYQGAHTASTSANHLGKANS